MMKTTFVQTERRFRRRLRIELLEDRCVPSTITPTTFADGGLGSGSLRDAVLQFNADTGTEDGTIQLLAGTYTLTIKNTSYHQSGGLDGDLYLTRTSHRWIIQGAGPSTIIDASQLQDRVFQVANPGTQVVFQDLVIQGGLAQDNGTPGALPGTTDALGGGLLNNGGDITLDNVVVQNNLARGGDVTSLGVAGNNGFGGGIYSTGGALTLARATLANNQASGGRGGDHHFHNNAGNGGSASGGGLYATGGTLDISASMVANNRVTGGRGGDGSYSFTCPCSTSRNGGNGGGGQGGGLYANGSALTILTSTIATNQGIGGFGGAYGKDVSGVGGGLYNGGALTVSDSTLSDNTAGYGGGISNSGTLMVSNSTLSGNSGGGISNGGTLTVSNSTLSHNTAVSGGGISNGGTLTVSNSTLSDNSSNGVYGVFGGGGIYNSGTATVSNSTLSGNTSARYGGGIINFFRTLTVTNSTLSGNSVTAGGSGGGIFNYDGALTVSKSTLFGNSASSGGGIENGGTLTVSNSTLSGNDSAYDGGGIYTSGTLPVTLTNVTLTDNRANTGSGSNRGGGLRVGSFSGSPVLHNTLIAGNFNGATGTTRDDVAGSLDPSGDYNLIGDGSGMSGLHNGINGNLVGSASDPIDPLLDALDNYGGPTQTMALLPGSPALNAGDPGQLGVPDQRGVVRTGGVNIGAYQASATAFVLDAPATVTAGVPFDVTVTAVDRFGQVAVGYSGTVTFSTTDPDSGVVLPADNTFTAEDGGLHTFSDTGRGETTLRTPGDQLLTVTDIADGTLTGSATVTVDPGGSARPFGPSTTVAINRGRNVQSSSAPADVERFFVALAEEETTFPWPRWQPWDPGESAG
jgi:hypothetical protein